HSVPVNAEHLQPDNLYWYRFTVGDRTSPVGRTRTTPDDGANPGKLRFAFASCQNMQDGYWTAYDPMVDEGAPNPDAVRTYRTPAPTDLATYRQRWADYKSDPALQAVHQQFPWVVTWDDHGAP